VELSSHDLDKHIIEQVNRFVRALKNADNRKRVADDLEAKIRSNPMDEAFVKQEIGTKEIYKFISDLVSQPPKIVIIIENKDAKLIEAVDNLIISPLVKEFKTFVREGAPIVHAHLFEPLYEEEVVDAIYDKSRNGFFCKMGDERHNLRLYNAIEIIKHLRDEHHIDPEDQTIDGWKREFQRQWEEYEGKVSITEVKAGDILEIEQRAVSERKFAYFHLTKNNRRFFPGYKVDFMLETDIGDIKTRVTSAKAGTQNGDPDAGVNIQGGLKQWYSKHPEVTVGRKVRFECIEPYKKYKLLVV